MTSPDTDNHQSVVTHKPKLKVPSTKLLPRQRHGNTGSCKTKEEKTTEVIVQRLVASSKTKKKVQGWRLNSSRIALDLQMSRLN